MNLLSMFFIFLVAATRSYALPIAVVEEDVLIGLDGIFVGDDEFRVRFATGEFHEAFGVSPNDYLVGVEYSMAGWFVIHQEVYDFLASDEGHFFEQNPQSIFGCELNRCNIYTPYRYDFPEGVPMDEQELLHFNREYSALSRLRQGLNINGYKEFDPEFPDERYSWDAKLNGDVFAVWNKVEVIEPSSWVLFLAGFLSLMSSLRNRFSFKRIFSQLKINFK